MHPNQLLTHFDRITQVPDAIPRLRSFILDLAVRGKLVEQDPRDEPASELLKRIQEEKACLVIAGGIRKVKTLISIKDAETPFTVPGNWCWVKLNDITSYIQRGKSPKYATDEGFPVISQKCVQWVGLNLHSAKLITRESIENYEPIRFLRSGDLLWNSTGTGTIGRIIKVKEPPPKLVCDSHVTVVRCLEVDAEYVRSWLRSDHVYADIEDRAAGSTNQVELTSQLAMNQVVPLPPLAEQHRIVAKVDELMALCDRLEAAQTERESQRDRLVAATHASLSNSTFHISNSKFFINHLPRLTTRPNHIKQLRQTILTLAVQGKLVPQDPTDESARMTLEKVQLANSKKWKEQSVTSGGKGGRKLAKRHETQLFSKGQDLSPLPNSWQWVSWESILAFGNKTFKRGPFGSALTKSIFVSSGYKVYEQYCPINDDCSFARYYITPQKFKELEGFAVKAGDFLISCSGVTLGRITQVPGKYEEGVINQALLRVRTDKQLIQDSFFKMLFRSPYFQKQIFSNSTGMAIPNVKGVADLKAIPLPLPPLAEQHRIVAKVDELMTLCNQLETRLTTTQTETHNLLEAVLTEVLTKQTEKD